MLIITIIIQTNQLMQYFLLLFFEEMYRPGRLYRSNYRFDSMDLSLVEGLNFEDRTFLLIYFMQLNCCSNIIEIITV